ERADHPQCKRHRPDDDMFENEPERPSTSVSQQLDVLAETPIPRVLALSFFGSRLRYRQGSCHGQVNEPSSAAPQPSLR
ncbi:hypothetical protein GBF38_017518, partial [Nibea albiflora]